MLELEKLWWSWVMQIDQTLHFFLQSLLLYVVVGRSTWESKVYLESQEFTSEGFPPQPAGVHDP